MTKRTVLFTLSAAALGVAMAKSAPLRTVATVDLNRYVGTWYQIARYPNRFQRKCIGDTSATYRLRSDGRIQVINSCREKDGEFNTAKGTAKVVDKATNTKLKVTFFWPFTGDYWIVGLGRDYECAIVGEPRRKYLWMLSRTPRMDPSLYDRAITQVEAAGYDAQNCCIHLIPVLSTKTTFL